MRKEYTRFDHYGCDDAECRSLLSRDLSGENDADGQLDGYGLLSALKQHKEYSMIPIIML